jgi:hypothetical protein
MTYISITLQLPLRTFLSLENNNLDHAAHACIMHFIAHAGFFLAPPRRPLIPVLGYLKLQQLQDSAQFTPRVALIDNEVVFLVSAAGQLKPNMHKVRS